VEDADAIARVHVASWGAAYAEIVPPELIAARTLDVRRREWREMLADSDAWATLVAELGGEVAGVSTFEAPGHREPPEEAEVRIFYVHPAYWRRGVGRALMAATLDALRADGVTRAVLWVMTENALGRAFYEALGWFPDGREGDWEGVPTVRYAKPLA
jgi:GNAT superfamily N-acetyltransferase